MPLQPWHPCEGTKLSLSPIHTTGACRGRGSKRKQKTLQSSFTHHVVGVKGREIGSR